MKLLSKILFFLFLSQLALAQHPDVDKEIKNIDSLIEYNRFDIAQKKIDSIYTNLKSLRQKKKYNTQLLDIRYREALLLDKQYKPPDQALKILLSIIDEAENSDLSTLSYRIYLLMALCYEKGNNLELTGEYLDKAYKVYAANKLESVFSTYCIRKSSYFYRHKQNLDSMVYYAQKASQYAQKYNVQTDILDAHLLLSFSSDYPESLEHSKKVLYIFRIKQDTASTGLQLNNIAVTYLNNKNVKAALLYNDSAKSILSASKTFIGFVYKTRSKIYEKLGNIDSSFYYFKLYHESYMQAKDAEDKIKTKELEEQYQNEKKETTLKNKNQQIILVVSLLGIITVSLVLLLRQNRKINKQNKTIGIQLKELSKTLEQKQVLLSELQHRVKNNLQHVISILEIQKESADFNNIDELIRGNQNRIHSMALLHKKLNVADEVNSVDLPLYITELSELVKDSYNTSKRKIDLTIKCTIPSMTIEQTLPIGLIIVELVSNSMKHAFEKKTKGNIYIEIMEDELLKRNKLIYTDDGAGFDFKQKTSKGLGIEIIQGLMDQLNGKLETRKNNGFELVACFK